MNPLDLAGPQFLQLYMLLLAGAVAVAAVMRARLKNAPSAHPDSLPPLDPYDTAYLAGGGPLAVQAALVNMAEKGVVAIDSTSRAASTLTPLPAGSHPLEEAVHQVAAGKSQTPVDGVVSSGEVLCPGIRTRLQRLGLIPTGEEARRVKLIPTLPLIAVLAFGGMKILIGLQRNRPVLFLILLCIVTGVIALGFAASAVARTGLGDRVLERLRSKNAALQMGVSRASVGLTGADLALAVGLFGLGALAATPLSSVADTLRPPQTSSGSSCGGSSCGSSCGGGCGGGGCGGCGG